jgi:hypothetical protein
VSSSKRCYLPTSPHGVITQKDIETCKARSKRPDLGDGPTPSILLHVSLRMFHKQHIGPNILSYLYTYVYLLLCFCSYVFTALIHPLSAFFILRSISPRSFPRCFRLLSSLLRRCNFSTVPSPHPTTAIHQPSLRRHSRKSKFREQQKTWQYHRYKSLQKHIAFCNYCTSPLRFTFSLFLDLTPL